MNQRNQPCRGLAARQMLILLLTFLSLGKVAAASPSEHLVLVGGGDTPPAALARFVTWGGGTHADILIVTWAGDEPAESFKGMQEELAPLHPAAVVAAPWASTMSQPTEKAAFLSQLSEATAVFFTGGDQSRAMDVMKDQDVLQALRKRYGEGIVFAGTSAGTAIMSEIMITGEGDITKVDWHKVATREGLGLLSGVIVDQHFLKRQRENRLMSLILHYNNLLGVGIDQDNALAIEDNRYAEVFGPTHVLMMDGREKNGKIALEFLQNGDHYDLLRREKIGH